MAIIRIEQEIRHLVFELGCLTVPNFGTFLGEYQSAIVDNNTGKIRPPSLSLRFDERLTINDGILTDYIERKYNLSAADAWFWIDTFVKDSKALLERNEVVIIPDMGRLLKEQNGNIRLLLDNENFNINAFGLPDINAQPLAALTKASPTNTIEKEGKAAEKKTLSKNIETKSGIFGEMIEGDHTPIPPLESGEDIAPPALLKPNSLQKIEPFDWKKPQHLAGMLLALIVGLGITMWLTKDPTPPNVVQQAQQNNSRINVRPTPPETPISATEGISGDNLNTEPPSFQNTSPNNTEDGIVPKTEDTDRFDNSTTSNDTGTKIAIITVGGFRNQKNIENLKLKIEEAGYTAYTQEKANGMTIVGCEFNYTDKSSFNAQLGNIKRKFGNTIKVIKK